MAEIRKLCGYSHAAPTCFGIQYFFYIALKAPVLDFFICVFCSTVKIKIDKILIFKTSYTECKICKEQH